MDSGEPGQPNPAGGTRAALPCLDHESVAWTPEQLPDLSGKNVIVTGANSGIGFETARALARSGTHRVLACRDLLRAGVASERIAKEHPTAIVGVLYEPGEVSDPPHCSTIRTVQGVRTMKPWIRRLGGVLLISTFLPVVTVGCFGQFRMTSKVYNWNKKVDPDKWVRWFAFVVLNVVPIYGFAVAIDALFANPVEFWQGKNPITSDTGNRQTLIGANGERMTLTRRADGAVDVVVSNGVEVARFTVVPEGESLSAWSEAGDLLARVSGVSGQPMLVAGEALAR